MRSATVVKVLVVPGIVVAGIGSTPAVAATASKVPAWTSVRVQTPAGSPTGLGFANMACPTKKVCWTAGEEGTASGARGVMERYHKGKFSLVHTPAATDLEGLSCPSARSCWVVGQNAGSTRTTPTIEHWNGKKWAKVSTPNPKGNDNYLDDVSCPSKRRCYAVGAYGSDSTIPVSLSALIELWNGKKWSLRKSLPAPSKAPSAYPSAISCVSATRCVAVGVYIPKGSFDNHAYSDVLRGKRWSLRPVPQPFHGKFAYSANSDVKCVAAKRCLMSGYAAPDANGRTNFTPEAWRLRGKSWKLLTLPKSYRTTGGGLNDVACASAKQCWLVGYEYTTNELSQLAVALRVSSHSIGSAHVAQPAHRYNEIDAVGCIRHGPCLAVGDSEGNTQGSTAFGDRTG